MFNYIILGIVQGVTEFLPISSSGHLLLLQKVLGVSANEIALSVVLHLGTTLSLILFFFKDIMGLFRKAKLLLLIIIVTVITGVIGIAGKDFFENLFSSPKSLAIGWIITAAILFLTGKFMNAQRKDLNTKDAVFLGFMQAVAIVPSISRSATTISALLFRGVDRNLAFEFSFLAAIPAVLGAALLEARKIDFALQQDSASLIAGFIFSFLAGLLSLFILKRIIDRAKFHYFGYYCIFIAIITIIFIK